MRTDSHRSSRRGQTTVEFSLVVGLVLLLLLGAVQVGLYAIERGDAVSADEAGVLAAVSAAGSPAGGPATAAVFDAVAPQLRSGLFGATPVRQDPVDGTCPTLSADWAVGRVFVCSAFNRAAGTVEVSVRGWVPALVPPGFGIGSTRLGALSIDIHQVAHVATFQP